MVMHRLVIGCCTLSAAAVWALREPDSSADFDGSVSEVHSRLAAMPMPADLEQAMGSDGDRVRTDSSDPFEVRWYFEIEGRSLGEVTAFLTEVDEDTTNVRVDFEPGDALPSNSAPYAVAKQPLVQQVAESYMAEQVAATLENRPFDQEKVAMTVAAYIGTHPAETQAYAESVEAMLDEGGEAPIGNAMGIDTASYGPQARSAPTRPAAPTTDLSRFR